MCGIYGVLGKPHGHSPTGLRSMKRRGPDNEAFWQDTPEDPWLGHLRLSIMDTRAVSHQPMVSASGRYIMTYNGEIYNFKELRSQLETKGYTFQTTSDSEVFLVLFEDQGPACLKDINGIFSVAFWDRQDKILTVARDPLGVKPLYMAHDATRFAFASELKALVRSGEVAVDLNPTAVARHLVYLWSPGDQTIVSDITKVLPGEVLQISADLTIERNIYRDGTLGKPVGQLPPDAYTPQKLAEQVRAAVDRQMVADVPVGAFLSGGLDSSAICAFAKNSLPAGQKLDCFTMNNTAADARSEGFADDLSYAKKVAQHLDVNLHVVDVDDSMNDRLMEYLYLIDEPTADPAGINALAIAELARDQGLKVLLSGSGGDDIFTGYRRHQAIAMAQKTDFLPKVLLRPIAGVAQHLPTRPALLRRMKKLAWSLGQDRNEQIVRLFQWQSPEAVIGLFSRDFIADLTDSDVNAPLFETLATAPADYNMMQSMLRIEGKHFLADHNLNYTDKTGMAAGIEVRVPLLDLDLVEYAHAIPTGLKQRGNVGKWILKKAMEPYLPQDVIYRPKTGFGVPLRAWFAGPMKHVVEDVLSIQSLAARNIFDPVAVQKLRRLNDENKVDATYTLFAVICMELWCRQYMDQNWSVDPQLGTLAA